MKGNLLEYRRILSGRIDIKKTEDLINFRGYLSLKKDPISEKIGHLNLIQKYSQIQFTDWLIGIVVLCGNDSYSFRQSSFQQKESQRRKPSFFQKKWNIQSIIQILMICFFSVIVIILRISMSCFKSLQFKGQMIPIAIDFIFTFPIYCSIINKFGFFLYAVVSNYLYHESKNGLQNQNFGLNSLNTFADMSQSSHIIFNSLKIQNQKQKNISTICLKDNFFRMKDNFGARENEQSNNNIKSNNTFIKAKPLSSNTRTDIGDDISFNSPNSNHKIIQKRQSVSGQLNYQNQKNILSSQNGVKNINIQNLNQISQNNGEDLMGKNQNQQPTSGLGIPGMIKKQAAQWKNSLQKIIELDSKSMIHQYDNDGQERKGGDGLLESSIKLRKNSFQQFEKKLSSKQGTNRSIQKKESQSQFEDKINNLQTFADNSDQENSLPLKMENHQTKRNVSITRLNIEQSPNITYYENFMTSSNLVQAPNIPKTIEDTDISYLNNVSHREFFQDGENQNSKNIHNISQNNSPKSQRRLTQGTSEKTSQIHSESKSSINNNHNNNIDVDQITFMKQSFAPEKFYQQLQILKQKSNGQQGEYSSPMSIPSSRPQFDINKNEQQIVSFDNISLYDKENQLKQEKKSPSKAIYYQPYQNGSGHQINFVSSPKWKNPSGTVNNFLNNGTNGQEQNMDHYYPKNTLQTDLIQTEQSQQINLDLSQSSSSVQNDEKTSEMKEQQQNEEMGSKRTPTYNSFKTPSIFKTNQTGQVSKKSLIDDFIEYGLRSSDDSDDEDSNEEDIEQRIETNGNQSSNRNLIYNTLNSNRLDTVPIQSSRIIKQLEVPNDLKSASKYLKKLNVVSTDTDQSHKNKNFNTNGLENLNLIYSEMDGSQTTSFNMQSQLDRVFNQVPSQAKNITNIPILDSFDFNSHDESSSHVLNNQDSKYQRMKRKKSLTNKIQKNNEKNNIPNNLVIPDEGTPQNNNLNTSSDFNSSFKASPNLIALNPKIQKLKQNVTSTDDLNSQDSLQQQKRLTLSSMYPSANNIQKAFDIYKRRGSNINVLKRSIPAFDNSQDFTKQTLEKNSSTREILFAMAICHETKTKGDRLKIGKKVSNVHLREETSYILEFTKNHNISFECSCTIQDQNYYIIKTDEGNEKVQIISKFFTQCNKIQIVYVQHKDQHFMILKSFQPTIPEYLVNSISTEKRQKLELLLSKVKQLGEKIIFYSKILLSEKQSYEFQNSFRLETQQEKIEQIYNKFIQEKSEDENNPILFLGFIGLQEESDMLMKDMIKELRRFGQKIWVLTSDSQQSTIESCYNYKILQDKGMNVLDFTGTNFDELFYKTRNHLQVLNKFFTQSNAAGKESIQVTQSAFDQPIKDSNSLQGIPLTSKNESQNPQIIERRPTIVDYNQSFRKYLPQQYNQQSSQTQLNIGGTSKRIIQQVGSNQTKNVILMEDDHVQESSSEEELNYYVILSGESLNVIRNNDYLWDHFCLIAFFAGGVVGYEMTDEQKSVLGQTITTRFHRSSQKVVNIVSSLNDVERQNFQQISVYVGSASDPLNEDKNIVISQHPDIYTKDTMSFLNVLIRESRFQSEMIEETMYLAIHRSYLSALVIIFWNIWTCSCNYPLFTPYQQIFFHGFQYLATIIYYIRRKREKFNSDKDSERSYSNFLYTYFIDFKQQHNEQQIPILNLKIIITSMFDIILLFLFYTTIYNFEGGREIDIGMLSNLIQWGIYIISFCRVFDLHFTKFDRYLIIYIISYIIIITIETVIFRENDTSIMILNHTFKNGYVLNTFLFICFFLAKSIFERCLLNLTPTSIIGLGKYIILSRKQAIEARKYKDQNIDLHKKDKRRPSKFFEHHFQDSENRSPDKDEVKQEDLLSSNQIKSKQGELLNNNMSFNKSENSSFNSFIQPIFSSNMLKNYKYKISPARIIRSIFKDKEMDIILSSMMQEEINLSQTQMSRFTLKFQIKEIEAIFLKGWELLIPYSNRIFYIFHFIVFDIGYDILVLSKVTNEFSAADGGYVMSYAITASAIFILTTLSLSKYYTKKNIMIISVIMVIVRSVKLILLSSFKQIIIYPTECIMHIAIACSCLRFTHYLLLIQGILLFGFFIIMQIFLMRVSLFLEKYIFFFFYLLFINLLIKNRTETSMKKWNIQTFLEAIGYLYDKNDGLSDSIFIIRTCFYISYFIILALFVSEKYNMILTIRKNYLSEHNLFKATMKVKDILSILLPKFIREKIETMKQGQYRVAEKQDEVVIVFCDICNFDDVIFNEKANTVRILDKLYRQFDLACQQNGLQKIETVGKTYLAAAGISNVESLLKAEGRLQDVSSAKRALNFAFDLQKIVKSKYLYLACNKKIILKIGIHLGPAISGVIGYHKPQFSLIGDTVNTTSRVCSTGLSDSITISSEVYLKVHHQCTQFKFQKRDVEAKGKGIMTTYQVFDKKVHRVKHVKKQTLNFLDDTAIINNNNMNTPPSITSNMPSFQQFDKAQFNFQSNRMNTLNQLEMSNENYDKIISDTNMLNSTSKKNSNKQIPLQAIPESPTNTSNTLIADIQLNYEKPDELQVPKNVQTSLANSDKSARDKKSPHQTLKFKQTSFGGVTDAITDEPLPINEERPRRRMIKKSSSFTIVDPKPRFQNNTQDANQFIQRAGSGKEYIIEENYVSPLMVSNNEFIKQLEKDLLMKIEVEPENIVLKELKLPLEKIQMHITHQDHLDKSIQTSKENSNSYSHIKMGICSTNKNATAEQKQLQTEFLKSILKQQVQSILVWLFFISLYFMIKFIIIIISVQQNSEELRHDENNKLQLIIFSIVNFLVFLPLTFTFRKIQNTFSWKQMRFLLYILYFVSIIFCSLQNFQLDGYLDSYIQYNIPLKSTFNGKTVNRSQVQLDSVTQVTLPSTIIFVLEIEFLFMFFTTFKSLYFLEKVGAYAIKILGYFIYSINKEELDSVTFFFIFIVGIIHLRIQYHHMQNEVLNFNNLKTLEMKKEELDSLLKNLLPSHILEQFLNSMKKEIPLVCEELDNVTLLFADIAGFTKYSSTTDPIVVVNMLRKLFTDFDDHCLNQNVYKLYTIGDCYVCFGLNNKNDRHPAQEAHNVVRFAFDMIRIIENVRQYTNCNLQMRIGIHTGKLYGGIVGTEIVRYDIYGQDVIIANKMESNGESGHVMVSETTKKLLEDHFPNEFVFDFKDSVHIKQINKNIDGFLIRFNEHPSEYLENIEESQSSHEDQEDEDE